MTHDIIQADVELATRLIADQRTDEEIIRALGHRGIDPQQAAQLLDDLHGGRKVTAKAALPPELSLRRRSRSASTTSDTGQRSSAHSPSAKPRAEAAGHRSRKGQDASPTFWRAFFVIAVVALAGVGFVLYQRYREQSQPPADTAPLRSKAGDTAQPGAAKAGAAGRDASATQVVLELQPDGLHVGGILVTRGNLLSALSKSLGPPNRTNQVAQTDTAIYAYDHLGVLIYSQPAGGTNSIVLDCDATGGVNGTTSPFAGLLKVEDSLIAPEMDSQQLGTIKDLDLKHPGTSETLWNGHYHDLGLAFAYLKTPRHLSLIVIDLK
jgi:hypothetical protein